MTESIDESDQESVFDASPYLKLKIDKDGRWFQNGAEITHQQIYLMFNDMLEETSDEGYRIRMGREICSVEVEDAPFVVLRMIDEDSDGLHMELNDKTREPFDPERFWIGAGNVPYCRVKEDRFHARFSRPAYYQVAELIEQDQSESRFYFVRGDVRVPIRTMPADE